MLRALHVQNFILIDDLTLDLGSGFFALTGETGAGKSLLVDALTALSGARAQKDWVRHGAKEAVVEAVFDLSDAPAAKSALEALGVQIDDEIVLRRTVSAEGRTRVVIGGQLAQVAELQRVARLLFSICGQNAHYELMESEAALQALDRYAQCEAVATEFARGFQKYAALGRELETLMASETQRLQRLDFVEFQVKELEEARLETGEETRLKEQRNRLVHAEKLRAGLALVSQRLAGDAGAAEHIGASRQKLRELTKLDPSLEPLATRLDALASEADDIGRDVERLSDRALAAGDVDGIEARLALLQRLSRKHGVEGEQLAERLQALHGERESLLGSDEKRTALSEERAGLERDLLALGQRLSAARKTAARQLGREVTERLRPLAMPRAEFFVALERAESLAGATSRGFDHTTFELATNPGEPRRALGKIASGGELSRVSLALEATLGRKADAPTYVFDEVDAGIGGAVAEVVGQTLATLGEERQVLCVTHLAQIAALATKQFRVEKQVRGNRTTSCIEPLAGKRRHEELARMLGGVEITDAVRRHAAELLERASA